MICSTSCAGFFQLVLTGRCRDKDHIPHVLLELVELQGPVVVRAREPEPVIDQGFLARAVAVIHAVELGNHLVALIDDHQEIVREIIEQAVGFLACLPPVEMPGVVLDPFAGSGLLDHLEIVPGPLFEPVRLDHPERGQDLIEFLADRCDRRLPGSLGCNEVPGRIDIEIFHLLFLCTGVFVHFADPLDLVAEHLDPDDVVEVPGDDIDGVPLDPEPAGHQFEIVSLEQDIEQPAHDLISRDLLADRELKPHVPEVLRVAKTKDAGDRSDHDHVAPERERGGGREPEHLDLGVDGRVLLDILVL